MCPQHVKPPKLTTGKIIWGRGKDASVFVFVFLVVVVVVGEQITRVGAVPPKPF